MLDKKYSVFVSSTYKDLREARQQVMFALLRMGCIPAGMELFPASNKGQWSVIQRVIDECDYYVLILGGRYGSIAPDSEGMGYTEKEFRYAVKRGIPALAFLHEDPESLLVGAEENKGETQEKREALQKFRTFLQEQQSPGYWKTPGDLYGTVTTALRNLIDEHPRPGWVRGDLVRADLHPATGLDVDLGAPQGIPGISEFDNLVFSAICNSLIEEGARGTEFVDYTEKTMMTVKSLKKEHTEEKVVDALARLSQQGLIGDFLDYLGGRHEPQRITAYGVALFFNSVCDQQRINFLRVGVAKFIQAAEDDTMNGDELYEKFRDFPAMQVDCVLEEIRGQGGIEISRSYSGHGYPTAYVHSKVRGIISGYIDSYSTNA